jgi:hypothetical protein
MPFAESRVLSASRERVCGWHREHARSRLFRRERFSQARVGIGVAKLSRSRPLSPFLVSNPVGIGPRSQPAPLLRMKSLVCLSEPRVPALAGYSDSLRDGHSQSLRRRTTYCAEVRLTENLIYCAVLRSLSRFPTSRYDFFVLAFVASLGLDASDPSEDKNTPTIWVKLNSKRTESRTAGSRPLP